MKGIVALFLLATLLFLTGCECLSGFGRDLQKAGEWVERKSEHNK